MATMAYGKRVQHALHSGSDVSLLDPQVCLEMAAAHPDSFDLKLPEGYASAAEAFHR